MLVDLAGGSLLAVQILVGGGIFWHFFIARRAMVIQRIYKASAMSDGTLSYGKDSCLHAILPKEFHALDSAQKWSCFHHAWYLVVWTIRVSSDSIFLQAKEQMGALFE